MTQELTLSDEMQDIMRTLSLTDGDDYIRSCGILYLEEL